MDDDRPVLRGRHRDDLLADVPQVLLQTRAAEKADEMSRCGDEDRAGTGQPDCRIIERSCVRRLTQAADGKAGRVLADRKRS